MKYRIKCLELQTHILKDIKLKNCVMLYTSGCCDVLSNPKEHNHYLNKWFEEKLLFSLTCRRFDSTLIFE